MPTCDICGEEVEHTFNCKMCGSSYCAGCGDPDGGVCTYCLGDEEEESFDDEWQPFYSFLEVVTTYIEKKID